jgi:hypothetical protein
VLLQPTCVAAKGSLEFDGVPFTRPGLCRYPNKADQDKKGILLVVTSGKDGAVSGGKSFVQVRHCSTPTALHVPHRALFVAPR